MSEKLCLLLVGVGLVVLDCVLNTGVVAAVGVICAWVGAYLMGTKYLIAALPPGAFVLLIQTMVVLKRKRTEEGREALLKSISELKGEEGVVVREDPLLVKVCGELWRAASKTRLRRGERVVVLDIKGNKLVVNPKKTGERR
ncbi:NfeD family protein [Methanopyrus sp.]